MNKQFICSAAEKYREKILEVAQWVWEHPETGYKEWNTEAYLADIFEKAGYELHRAGNIPGFYTDIDTGNPGPKVLILGEMDALPLPTHFQAVNGNAHACGHNIQCASIAGIALALKEPGALDGLSGSVRIMAVPAEELVEIDFRRDLAKQGIIRYLVGKAEFMYRGFMDDVDIAYMFHATPRTDSKFNLDKGANGVISKEIVYSGVASHAAGSPEKGINALYAATLGLQAINSIRETFVEKDYVRVHPIMNEGGQAINIIPSKAVLSTYVRGASWEAILDANKKVNRALAGAALSVGASVRYSDAASFSPYTNDYKFSKLMYEVMSDLIGEENVIWDDSWGTGSTDMGELAMVMPIVHPHISTSKGNSHGDDYEIDRPEGIIDSVKGQVAILNALLENGAARAKDITDSYIPTFKTKQEYFAFMDSVSKDVDMIRYTCSGAEITF